MSCKVMFHVREPGGSWRNYHLPAPNEGMEATNNTWGQVQQYTNGFFNVVSSAYGARQYNLSWTNLSGDDVWNWRRAFQPPTPVDIYFADPFSFSRNAAPPLLASPELLISSGSPMAFDRNGDPTMRRTNYGGVEFIKTGSVAQHYDSYLPLIPGTTVEVSVVGDVGIIEVSQSETDEFSPSTGRPFRVTIPDTFDDDDYLFIRMRNDKVGKRLSSVVVTVNPGSQPNRQFTLGATLGFGAGALKIVPGSAVLVPVNAARDRWAASVSLVEVYPWE